MRHAGDNRLALLGLREVEAMLRDQPAWLVEGVVPARGLTLLVGPSFAGKSRVAASIGANVSVGAPWCERATSRCSVAWVAADRGLAAGFAAIGSACRAVDGASISMLRDPWSADVPGAIEALDNLLSEHGVELLVVDCLRAVFEGDENDSGIRGLMQSLQRLAASRAVLLVHHAAHTGRPRGSTDIQASSESVLSLTRRGDRLTLDATHHVAPPLTLALRDVPVEGGHRIVLSDDTSRTETTAADIRGAIVRSVESEPGCSTRRLRERVAAEVGGKTERIEAARAQLLREGAIVVRAGARNAKTHWPGVT